MRLKGIIAAAAVLPAVGALAAAGLATPLAPTASLDYKPVCASVPRGYMRCMALVRTDVPISLRIPPKPPRGGVRHLTGTGPFQYEPADLTAAYHLGGSIGNGSGETVAIVDAYNNPNAASDLAYYRSYFGLPAASLRVVNEHGQASPLPPDAGGSGWASEESLDLDMVSAICPRCGILLVEADSATTGDLGTAVDTAVALGARYVSNSYGAPEYLGENSDDHYYNHPGTVVTVAAGDSGYGVSYPAASRYVTAVGGTSLYQDPGTPRGWRESVWGSSAGGDGTGSGCSAYEAKPAWQADSGCANRTDNDVAADADPNTGAYVYDTYDQDGWAIFGGTSLSSPVIASVYALAGRPASGDYPASYPYLHTSDLNDVTTGVDGTCSPAYLCSGRAGYDGPTGWGTPNGVAAFRSPGGVLYSGTIRLRDMPGNLALDDRHNSRSNGAVVQVWRLNGLPNQVWQVLSDGTIRHNGLCLDAVRRGTGNGTKVQLWQCNGGANQLWDTRGFRVHYDNPAARNKVLDDTGYGGNGTQVQIWTDNGTRNQIWVTR